MAARPFSARAVLVVIALLLGALVAVVAQPSALAAPSSRAFGAGEVRELIVTGQDAGGAVPEEGAAAVIVNLTATNATAPTYIVAWAAGQPMPSTSNLNAAVGEDRANLAIVPVGTDGKIQLFNHTGRVDLVVDVLGWIPDDGRYRSIAPRRLLDSRSPGGKRLTAGGTVDASLGSDVPAGALAVVNLTGVGASDATHLTLWPADDAAQPPATSNLNLVPGEAIANLALIAASTNGRVRVANHAGTTDVVVDLLGWFAPGSGITAIAPARLADTRATGHALASGETLDVTFDALRSSAATAIVNLTGIQSRVASYVTAWDATAPARPPTSNLNLVAGRPIANLALVALNDGRLRLSSSAGQADLIVDALGWVLAGGPLTAVTPRRLMDTREAPSPAEVPPPIRVRRAITYSIATTGTITANVSEFAALAAETLHDQRGWARAGVSFTEVASGGDFTLWLAAAERVPSFGSPCSSTYSCRVGRNVIINETRWRTASPAWASAGASLRDYRHLVVNHEVGHWLGRGHAPCPGAGQPAPVMQQQSKGLAGCTPNPWPLPNELPGAGAPAR